MWESRRVDAKLRAIQREYYESPRERVPDIFGRYVAALREGRALQASSGRRDVKLHLGCGDHLIDGWTNVDLPFHGNLAANLGQALPVKSGAVDFLHSEEFLEHLDLPAGKRFLAECFRVLKRGGVLRLLTPDLRALVERVYLRREKAHLDFCHRQLATEGPCEALNMWMRMEGDAHRFVWDFELLDGELRKLGFEVTKVRCNASVHPSLRYLDLRDFGLNLSVEATKSA